MSKKEVKSNSALKRIKTVQGITEYVLPKNGLRVLFAPKQGSGVVTSNIVYHVGSRDEAVGETGIAHMFEHMLFKPTRFDLKQKKDSAIMRMERETGSAINANTWKDRTTYYICYPKNLFSRALQIEAERMQGLVFSEPEFKAEQGNVLSEFDMYAGDEQFSLAVQMAGVAMQSHPYGHETIGYREDIASYTTEKLESFYKKYYAPNNAVLTIVGDIGEDEMKKMVIRHFEKLKASKNLPKRVAVQEPTQEGIRTVTVERKSTTQIFALGVLHDGFPSKGWFETMVIFDMLAGGDDSILYRELVDTGLATEISTSLEPSYDRNLGIIFITLTNKMAHEEMHTKLQSIIKSLTVKTVAPYLQKTIAKSLTHEFTTRENSLGFTAELVEYVSAGAWERFFDSESTLRSITAADIHSRLAILFDKKKLTIGNFIGTK